MKKFFSLYHFRELKILLSLELIVMVLTLIISLNQNLSISFSSNAAIASLACYSVAAIIDPKRYFNFFTLLAIGIFGYGVWSAAFLFLPL